MSEDDGKCGGMTFAEFWEIILAAKPVFWVCPKGCRGQVEWNTEATKAKCMVCGEQSQDRPRTEPTP